MYLCHLKIFFFELSGFPTNWRIVQMLMKAPLWKLWLVLQFAVSHWRL